MILKLKPSAYTEVKFEEIHDLFTVYTRQKYIRTLQKGTFSVFVANWFPLRSAHQLDASGSTGCMWRLSLKLAQLLCPSWSLESKPSIALLELHAASSSSLYCWQTGCNNYVPKPWYEIIVSFSLFCIFTHSRFERSNR